MRYYKGDTLLTVRIMPTMMSYLTIDGEGQLGVVEESFALAKNTGGCRISSKMRDGAFSMRGPLGPQIPLGVIETTEITSIGSRPWYNHLRAFWDNIFRP